MHEATSSFARFPCWGDTAILGPMGSGPMRRCQQGWALALLFVTLGGCGDSDGGKEAPGAGGSAPGTCGAGELEHPAGGCCAAGTMANDAGGCCPAGTTPLPDGGCLPAGIPAEQCAVGFEPFDDGCEPILPNEACPSGLMAVPGEASCRAVMPCGVAPWGDIPTDGTTQHVDQSYPGGNSDGSAERPWTTINDALAAAAPGALVAVAAGSYAEEVTFEGKPIRLWGVCPQQVEIIGAAGHSAVLVKEGADGSEVVGVALTGEHNGFGSSGSLDLLVDRVWIHDTALAGATAMDGPGPTSLRLRDSLVERSHGYGVLCAGSEVSVERTVIRDTLALDAGEGPFGRGVNVQATATNPASLEAIASVIEQHFDGGVFAAGADVLIDGTVLRGLSPAVIHDDGSDGIYVQDHPIEGTRGSMTLRGSLVDGHSGTGVTFQGTGTIEATVVRRTSPAPADEHGEQSSGVWVEGHADTGQTSQLTMRRSIVEDSVQSGIVALQADLLVEATIVRRTAPGTGPDWDWGTGILAQPLGEAATPPPLVLRNSVIEDSVGAGLALGGVDLLVEGTVVRDTAPAADHGVARGIHLESLDTQSLPASARLVSSLVERSDGFGVLLHSADGVLQGTHVSDTRSVGPDLFGDGIVIYTGTHPASADIDGCLVDNSLRAAITNRGGVVAIRATRLRCNALDLVGQALGGAEYVYTNQGETYCGCPVAKAACKVVSAELEPPPPIPPGP